MVKMIMKLCMFLSAHRAFQVFSAHCFGLYCSHQYSRYIFSKDIINLCIHAYSFQQVHQQTR